MYSRASASSGQTHALQSDDDFQRHEAERRRREGRGQDQFGEQRSRPQDSYAPRYPGGSQSDDFQRYEAERRWQEGPGQDQFGGQRSRPQDKYAPRYPGGSQSDNLSLVDIKSAYIWSPEYEQYYLVEKDGSGQLKYIWTKPKTAPSPLNGCSRPYTYDSGRYR